MPRKTAQLKQLMEQPKQHLITDTDYIYSHFEELIPVNMKYVAALNGFKTAPLNGEFTYVDLGCGNGITLSLMAAAYPKAKFFALDEKPEHIAFVKNLKAQGQLKNLQIMQVNYDKVDWKKIPESDFMVAHGILSWVNQERRERIRKIVDRKLKQNGLLYVNYNTLPGWSAKAPFLELIHYFTPETENDQERLYEGIKQLKILCNENAGYFAQNPMLKAELERFNAKSFQYLMHEYMNGEWQAFYFREINEFFEEIGLQMAGSFPFRDNFKNLIIPSNFHSLLDMQSSRSKYEEYKDFVINSRVRKNIYVRNQEPHVVDDHDPDLYADMFFTTLKEPYELTESVRLGNLSYDIKGPGYDALRELLPNHSMTMVELLNQPAFRAQKVTEVIDIINNFVVLHQAIPCAGALKEVSKVDVGKLTMTHPLNRYLLDNVYPKGSPITLACPATGTMMACNHVAAIVLDSILANKGNKNGIIKQAFAMAHELHEDEIFADVSAVEQAIDKVEEHLLIWLARMDVIRSE